MSSCPRRHLSAGLAALKAALPAQLPRDGLAPLLERPQREPLPPVAGAGAQAAEYLAGLARTGAAPADGAALLPLIGLGPGLTPSGDDFLAAALVALHSAGEMLLRDAIWAALAPAAPALTTGFSFARLATAAAGHGDAALHALIDDVLAGRTETIAARVRLLTAIGHTSGWDALAGAVTALNGLRARADAAARLCLTPSAPDASRSPPAPRPSTARPPSHISSWRRHS